jgi:formate-dependent nitrite reductase membrane component NrfD
MGAAVATCAAHDETLVARLRGVMLFLGAAQPCLLLLAGLALYGGSPALERALGALIGGRTAAVFWGLVMGVGLGVPLVALAAMRQRCPVTIASALCLFVGAATLRFLLFTVA